MQYLKKIKKIFASFSDVSSAILSAGSLTASLLMFTAISFALKGGYDYYRLILQEYITETSAYILFLSFMGGLLFEYMRIKKEHGKE